jgi:arabinogalactan oligomer / maltooligosaccharide transport system permease protein
LDINRIKKYSLYTGIHLFLIVYCIISVYPLLRIVAVSLRPGNRLFSTDLNIIPSDASFISYVNVIMNTHFLLWIWNSLVITVTTALVGVIIASASGYAFSRFRFPGKKAGLIAILGTQMIPAGMLLLPVFIILIRLNWVNSYIGLVVAYSISSLPFSIWILKGYYDTIPKSLEEAALVDGTSMLGAFYRIILPLSTPALAIAFLFNFTMAWNEFLVARVVLQKSEMYTWTLGLFELQGQYITQWGMFCAASIMITIPVLLLFMYSSKWLISGLTLGGVKG